MATCGFSRLRNHRARRARPAAMIPNLHSFVPHSLEHLGSLKFFLEHSLAEHSF